MFKKNKGSIIFAIIGICTLILAIAGSAYAYYQASATANIVGTAGGGEGPTLTVSKISNSNAALIPIDMDTTTLTKAAKGWNTSTQSLGTEWNASRACIDKNGNTVCQIYSITLKNNTLTSTSYNIGITSLSGSNTPNIDVVKMNSNISVNDANSIKGNDTGIADHINLAGGSTSATYYIMVIIKNKSTAQTDNGNFSGTITATGSNGSEVKATFGDTITFYVEGTPYNAIEGMTWGEFINSSYNTGNVFEKTGSDVIYIDGSYINGPDYTVSLDELIVADFHYEFCLTGDTIINTKNGYLEIKDLKEGDLVLSYNEQTGKNEYKRVSKIGKFESKTIGITFDYDNIVNMTLSHPMYLYTGEVVRANELKVGDKIKTIDGYTTITSIDDKLIDNTVYMVTVEDNHNFYITYDNLLSHNKPT